MDVSDILIHWYIKHKRDLPWRRSVMPYHIWLSEIIMQQTRVSQGLAYYVRFTEKYPDIHSLAAAPLEDVLKLWQGLGYYSRARNMHETARMIVNDHDGVFPQEFSELLKLKGVGTYTAAAISSIAFNKPVALMDGNVFRVLARIYGIFEVPGTKRGEMIFNQKAFEILNKEMPGIHNEAMMEFGALVCTPQKPQCNHCIFQSVCLAFKQNRVGELPSKKPKTIGRIRYFNYVFPVFSGNTILVRREHKDIWHLLYEFPLHETIQPADEKILYSHPLFEYFSENNPVKYADLRRYKHKLTHQTINCTFMLVMFDNEGASLPVNWQITPLTQLHEYAIPRIVDRYLSDLTQEGLL